MQCGCPSEYINIYISIESNSIILYWSRSCFDTHTYVYTGMHTGTYIYITGITLSIVTFYLNGKLTHQCMGSTFNKIFDKWQKWSQSSGGFPYFHAAWFRNTNHWLPLVTIISILKLRKRDWIYYIDMVVFKLYTVYKRINTFMTSVEKFGK